jgi:hypothetical protein
MIMRSFPIVVCALGLVLVGCGSDTSTGSSVTTTADPVATQAHVPRERVYVTTLEDFPDWVPLPEAFVVIMGGRAGGTGMTVIETSGDPRAVVAHLNTQLEARGLKTINAVEDEGKPDRYLAQGVVSHEGKVAVINIGEYDPGGAMKPGNTMSISYSIGG